MTSPGIIAGFIMLFTFFFVSFILTWLQGFSIIEWLYNGVREWKGTKRR